jgi:hypothetical protein
LRQFWRLCRRICRTFAEPSGEDGGVATESHPVRLSSDEVALVLRRAADLEAHAGGRADDEGFDAAAVEEAAREVGLSPIAVRQALAELHTGTLSTDHRRRPARTRPSVVQVARLVPCPPAVVHSTADDWFRHQTLELRRRQDHMALYRQRRDLAASLRRGLDVNGAIQLEGVDALTLTVTPLGGGDDRCVVRMVAELRGRAVMTTLANVAGFTAAGMAAVPVFFFSGVPGAIPAALGTGAGVTVGGLTIGSRWWRRRREQVTEVLDGLLDSLERP